MYKELTYFKSFKKHHQAIVVYMETVDITYSN